MILRIVVSPVLSAAQKNDVSRSGVYFEHRSTTVQAAFGGNAPGSPIAALGGNLDFREIGTNAMAITHVDSRANRNRQVGRQIDGDVPGGGLQNRIAEPATSGDELRGNAAATGF